MGESFSWGQLFYQTGVGAILGPVVSKVIPLRGPTPNLLAPRSLQQLLKPAPNTCRLYHQGGLAALLDFLVGQAMSVSQLKASPVDPKK